jgi:hypothetical protein
VALVPRRVLARILQENRRFLSKDQIHRHIAALNRGDKSSLACEYEVLLLNAASKLGTVVHEPDLPGPAKLDLLFSSPQSGSRFLADITTVSDEDAYRNNPVEDFRRAFGQLLKKQGLTMAGISVRVEGELRGGRGKQKMTLKLPSKTEIPRIVKDRLTGFVNALAAEPARPHEVVLQDSDLDVRVGYDPREKATTGGHPSFTVPYSKSNNPLSNALKKKASQLAAAGFEGVTGIVLCDGDCDAVRSVHLLDGGARRHFRGADLIGDFLRRHSSISFVTSLTVKQPYPRVLGHQNPLTFETAVFLNQRPRYACPEEVAALLARLPALLPAPESTPANVLNHFRYAGPHVGLSFYGGSTMTNHEIRISTRALTELLAGKIDLKRFREDHHLVPSKPGDHAIDFFKNQIKGGRTVESVRIERSTDKDDDWIVFVFGGPDPAISLFRNE